jgi:hypothetical protein
MRDKERVSRIQNNIGFTQSSRCLSVLFFVLAAAWVRMDAAQQRFRQTGPVASRTTLADLNNVICGKARSLENSNNMRPSFRAFSSAYKLPPKSVSYSNFAIVRLLFEATRDAGFWNLHWAITDMPPNSDNIWRQWRNIGNPIAAIPTATAGCDELSALYAFLAGRAGVKDVGLFWPYYNHTVAVWALHPSGARPVRVVVPTTQIFLSANDFFGTGKFNPWSQKTIHEYVRRDVSDSFELPKPLFNFFISQMDKYGGASDETLQRLRYLREGVFRKLWKPDEAALQAFKMNSDLASDEVEDSAALREFAKDMRSGSRPE